MVCFASYCVYVPSVRLLYGNCGVFGLKLTPTTGGVNPTERLMKSSNQEINTMNDKITPSERPNKPLTLKT